MIYSKFELNKLYPELVRPNVNPIVSEFVHEPSEEISLRRYPAVIICPGGGYWRTSDREADVVAHKFFSSGFNAYVLRYTTAPYCIFPEALFELAALMDYVRSRASAHKTIKNKVAVCGFSAGGHLAASLGVYYDSLEEFRHKSELAKKDPAIFRPDALILGYAVLTSGKYTHIESMKSLMGREPTEEDMKIFSVEAHVTDKTPPSFIWTTANDLLVPSQNSVVFAERLADAGVPYELHIFSDGLHGLSLSTKQTAFLKPQDNPRVAKWFDMCMDWFADLK